VEENGTTKRPTDIVRQEEIEQWRLRASTQGAVGLADSTLTQELYSYVERERFLMPAKMRAAEGAENRKSQIRRGE
jgi:hypothetical protein